MELFAKLTRNLLTALCYLSFIISGFAFTFSGATLTLRYIFVLVKKLLVDSRRKELLGLNESNTTALRPVQFVQCPRKLLSVFNKELDVFVFFCLKLTLQTNGNGMKIAMFSQDQAVSILIISK